MKPLAPAALEIAPSQIREILDLALGIPDAIRLEAGEPNFPTPPHIIAAAQAAAAAGFTKYTANAGLLSLRELIVEKLQRRNRITATTDQIIVTPGGVAGLFSTIIAVVAAGEEVLLPDPGWPNAEMATRMIGARPVRYPLDPARGYLPDLDALERLASPRSKLLLVNTPSNPAGAVFPREVLLALLDFARRHDLWVLSDEIYEEMVFEGEHIPLATLDPDGRVITLYGFSKSYAMTGWRVGYLVAPREVAAAITKLQEPITSCVCTVSQKAAEAALTGPQDCVAEMREAYRARRDAVVEILRRHGRYRYRPSGAFYIVIDVGPAGIDSRAFARWFLQEYHVAVAPGTAFGEVVSNGVRVSLASAPADLQEGVTRLCAAIERYPSAAGAPAAGAAT